ncbi:MAG: metallophosphoesterase, partial [Candidatus Bathyarchaeota archaeon]
MPLKKIVWRDCERMTELQKNMDVNERLKKVIHIIFDAGYQIDSDAFNVLQAVIESADPEEIVKALIEKCSQNLQPVVFITKKMVEDAIKSLKLNRQTAEELKPVIQQEKETATGKMTFYPLSKDVDAEIEILKDPTKEISSTGDIDCFLKCFRDRFQRLQKMLKQRLDVRDATNIGAALKERTNAKVKLIGMVSDKIDRGKKIILRLDDFENTATILVQSTKPRAIEKAQLILLDQVICIQGVRGPNELIIAEDILWPDIPSKKPNMAPIPIHAALTSDFHIGSKFFKKTLLERFIKWLNGRIGSEKERELAGHVKYLIVAGDLVDGIGIYPQQEHELEITDIFKQYEAVGGFIEQIPDHIEVILTPGNHDAVRRALPQPSIPEKYANSIYRARKVISLGNPAQVKVHGVNILIHHGRSLEDLLVSLPNATHKNPT